jgi:thioredoxin reductase (NADPH)
MDSANILLVGAGPIGLEMGAALTAAGATCRHIEAGVIGQTIWSLWPRNTEFLSAPDEIALAGVPLADVRQYRVLNEDYLAYLRTVAAVRNLTVRTHTRLRSLLPDDAGWTATLQTPTGEDEALRAERVILATGDMHSPARLGVPGEDLPHVYHAYRDIHQFFARRVLVVGDGNGAVETAIRCSRIGCEVALTCWDADLPWDRISHKFAALLRDLIDAGRIRLLTGQVVTAIDPAGATLAAANPDHTPRHGTEHHTPADAVVIQIGYRADTDLLHQAGVTFEPDGSPAIDPQTMETTAAGLYLVGTAIAAGRCEFPVFIQNGHAHVGRVVDALGLDRPGWLTE